MWGLVIISMLTLYVIAIVWTYHSMSEWEGQYKIIYILSGTIVIFVFTLLLVSSTKGAAVNEKIEGTMRFINVLLFAPVNSLLLMPQIGRVLNRAKAKTISTQTAQKRVVMYVIVFIVFLFFEVGYIKDFQNMIQLMITNKTK